MNERNFSTEIGVIYLAGGCFWCTEAVYEQVNGIVCVLPGYMGDTQETANYETVCSGTTAHAECVQLKYNPASVSLEDLFDIFFATHDPTTLNYQGNDVGPQYRSAIFYTTQEQRKQAENYISQLTSMEVFDSPIVTAVEEAKPFYEAEDYHHHYFKRNPLQPYCYYVVRPKLEKLRAVFADRLAD